MGDAIHNFPSDNRLENGSADIKADPYPAPFDTTSVNPDEAAVAVVDKFNYALYTKDYSSLGELFLQNGYWKDHLCQSWDFRTLKGGDKIADFLKPGSKVERIVIDRAQPHRAPQLAPINAAGDVKVVQFFIKVTTSVGSGRGVMRLTKAAGEWKILTLYTILEDLKGHEEPRGDRRPRGKEHDGLGDNKTWKENREAEMNQEDRDPAVLIVGAGQGGLTAASRLKMLNVDALVIDREERIGDNWRSRYRRLILHDPVWMDHLPYLPFPDSWPIFTPKDKLGDFFEAYASLLELNVWTRTELVSSVWHEDKQHWTVVVERRVGKESSNFTKETRTFHPRHIIQATGHSGKKNFPTIKGMGSFKGLLCHSADFPGAVREGNQGKKAVIIGACNSSHDIAQDYYEKGYDVTMVQRTTTCIVSSHAITDIGLRGGYDEAAERATPLADRDLVERSLPAPLYKRVNVDVAAVQHEADRPLLESLQRAGFGVDKGPDYGGLQIKYFQRGGGYCIDVGASQLIIDGKIKVKHGHEVDHISPDGLTLADGTCLPADEIVFATGYQNMRTQSRLIFGDALADRVSDVWGWDAEGEFRAMWRPSGHPGFWFMGGNLALCRYYSQLLGLQIKAREVGLV